MVRATVTEVYCQGTMHALPVTVTAVPGNPAELRVPAAPHKLVGIWIRLRALQLFGKQLIGVS